MFILGDIFESLNLGILERLRSNRANGGNNYDNAAVGATWQVAHPLINFTQRRSEKQTTELVC